MGASCCVPDGLSVAGTAWVEDGCQLADTWNCNVDYTSRCMHLAERRNLRMNRIFVLSMCAPVPYLDFVARACISMSAARLGDS